MTSRTYNLTNQDSSSYESGYEIFLRRSDFRERVVEKFNSLQAVRVRQSETLSILDLGCGNGRMTKRYLDCLGKPSLKQKINLVEPAQSSLEEAMSLLSSDKREVWGSKDLPMDKTFDLIIASYVFYHLPSDTVNQIAKLLSPGGSFVIMMGTSEHPLKSHPDLKAISKHGSSDKLDPFLRYFETSGSYTVSRHRFDTFLDLEGLWEDGHFTIEAQKLLGFSLNSDFDQLPSQALKAVEEIFGSAFKSEDAKLRSVHEIIWIERIK